MVHLALPLHASIRQVLVSTFFSVIYLSFVLLTVYIFIQTGGIGLAPDKTPLLNKKERDFFVPQNWSSTQDRKRDRSRDNFLDDEPEISTLKPRNNNRRRILKKTDEKKNIGETKSY